MTTFHDVAGKSDLAEGSKITAEIDDHEIMVVNDDGEVLAVSNICTCIAQVAGHSLDHDADDPHTHGGRLARLEGGEIRDGAVTCPMHGSTFDLRTGKATSGMADIALDTYEVRIEEGRVKVAGMADAERHFWHDDGEKERP